ncbi:MAG: hypothetical protein B5M51_07385, partial [Anaerolinea sp. 4484_236]
IQNNFGGIFSINRDKTSEVCTTKTSEVLASPQNIEMIPLGVQMRLPYRETSPFLTVINKYASINATKRDFL